jgi:hypothetical protein
MLIYVIYSACEISPRMALDVKPAVRGPVVLRTALARVAKPAALQKGWRLTSTL